jgi:hypothetical protein
LATTSSVLTLRWVHGLRITIARPLFMFSDAPYPPGTRLSTLAMGLSPPTSRSRSFSTFPICPIV